MEGAEKVSSDGVRESVERSVTADDTSAEASTADAEATGSSSEASAEEQRVPLDRFRSVTSENKELRAKLDELNSWKEEQEAAQLTELERERQAREKAEAEALTAAQRVEQLERGGWLRSAAVAAGFADPDDAVALIGTSDVEDADAAAERVRELADRKPHLLNAAESGPARIGAPLAQQNAPVVNSDDPRAGLGAELLGYIKGKG
jgi:hypothetical protein